MSTWHLNLLLPQLVEGAWLQGYNVFGGGVLAVAPARGVPFCINAVILDWGLDLSQSI